MPLLGDPGHEVDLAVLLQLFELRVERLVVLLRLLDVVDVIPLFFCRGHQHTVLMTVLLLGLLVLFVWWLLLLATGLGLFGDRVTVVVSAALLVATDAGAGVDFASS